MHIGIRKTDLSSLAVETGALPSEHFHENPELIKVLNGKLKVSLNGERYLLKKEDCLLINSNCRHRCQPEKGGYFLRFSFSYSKLKELLGEPVIEFWCNSAIDDGDNYIGLRKVLTELLAICVNTEEYGLIDFYEKSYECIRILADKFLVYKGAQESGELAEEERRYRGIVNYINDNYSQHISLDDLAEQVHLTSSYLSKYIKKKFNVNFIKYLNDVRMSHAVGEILDSDISITDIAYENGFPNMASFNKLFKETYETTPLVYRNKKKKERIAENQSGSAEEEKRVTLEKVARYLKEQPIQEKEEIEKALAVVSANEGVLFEKNWNKVINIGSAEDILQSATQEHIVILKKELDVQYVRFWNIFGKGMHVEAQRKGNYNFTNIYRILDFLLQIGVKPYIELGIKSRQIIKSIGNMIEIKDETSFHSIAELEGVMQSFMEHIVRRYGVDEVNTWYFESWHDPVLPLIDADMTYFSLFNTAYRIIKEYAPKAQAGGCGSTVSNPTEPEIETVIKAWKDNGQMPDFFSIYVYPYPYMKERNTTLALKENTKQSTDIDFLKNQVTAVQ